MAKKYLMHNEGTIVRPHGKPLTAFSVVPDAILMDASLSAAARLVLTYIAGRPPGWVATVTDIKKKLSFSESQWKSARDALKQAGIIPLDHPKRMGGGVNRFSWVLDLLMERYYLSTAHPSETADAQPSKIADGSHQRFSMDGKVADYQEEFTNTKKPPTPTGAAAESGGGVVVFDVDQRAGHTGLKVQLEGLTSAELLRVERALADASANQVQLFSKIWDSSKAAARSPVALAIALAKLAAKGHLNQINEQADQPHSADVTGESAACVCARHSSETGHLVSPAGLVAIASAAYQGLLQAPAGGVFSLLQSSKFWLRLEAGEFDFHPIK